MLNKKLEMIKLSEEDMLQVQETGQKLGPLAPLSQVVKAKEKPSKGIKTLLQWTQE